MLYLMDQRRLPDELVEYPCRSAGEVAYAIREMVVRGAPAIGQVAAIGLAMSAEHQRDGRPYARKATIRGSANALINARPTAVNLRWAVERVLARYTELGELSEDGDAIADAMRAEADAIVLEATTDHGRLASSGWPSCPSPTTARSGSSPTATPGRWPAASSGRRSASSRPPTTPGAPVHVWVDETRPYLQGARLTTWELAQAGVPHALLPDVAAGHLMAARRGGRRARRRRPHRGQRRHGQQGRDVPAGRPGGPPRHPVLRLRADQHGGPRRRRTARRSRSRSARADEVTELRGVRIAPAGTEVRNPAFDVTPAELITGIVTEEGVIRAPYGRACARRSRGRAAAGRRRPGSSARPRHGPPRRARRARRPWSASRLMATVAVGRRGGIVARATTDKALLRALPRARPSVRRVRDLRPRGARVRADALGHGLGRRPPIALVLEYNGPTPQPLFVMGRDDGVNRDPARPHPAAGRLRRRAAAAAAADRDRPTASTPARRWSGCGSTGPASGRTRRPSSACCRSRSASSTGCTSSASRRGCRRARSPTASTTASASTASWWPRPAPTSSALGPAGGRRQRPDPVDYRGRGFATAVTGAVTAELLRTCDQVVLNVRSDNPPALNAYRRLGYAEHVRFEERLVHRLGSPWPDIAARCAASSIARRPTSMTTAARPPTT